jgi:O-antigen/teichoic acid export membrane protein
LVTVAGNIVLIPFFGLWGAAWSAVICYLVIAILITRKSQALFPIAIRWPRLVPVLAWLAAGWAFGAMVQMGPGDYGWGMRLGALAAFWILPFALGMLRMSELRNLLPAFARKRPSAVP